MDLPPTHPLPLNLRAFRSIRGVPRATGVYLAPRAGIFFGGPKPREFFGAGERFVCLSLQKHSLGIPTGRPGGLWIDGGRSPPLASALLFRFLVIGRFGRFRLIRTYPHPRKSWKAARVLANPAPGTPERRRDRLVLISAYADSAEPMAGPVGFP